MVDIVDIWSGSRSVIDDAKSKLLADWILSDILYSLTGVRTAIMTNWFVLILMDAKKIDAGTHTVTFIVAQ